MTLQDELRESIKKVIDVMRNDLDVPDNTIEYILNQLEQQGHKEQIELIGTELTMDIIANELNSLCDDLIYQISIEQVVSIGLKGFFSNNSTTVNEAAKYYAQSYMIEGNMGEILSHIVTSVVNPLLKVNPMMTRREAILFIGQNSDDYAMETIN